ncbi:MAG: GEVED domain-containing protein [Flavobacteriales bacterium]
MMRPLLIAFGAGLLLNASAQTVPHDHRTCGAHTFTKRHLEQQGLSTDLLHHLPTELGEVRGGTLTVPVVVHVVWNTAAENVSTGTINALLAEMNADFNGTNGDLNQVRPTFSGVVGNPGIQFCLAQVDPNGAATTGIVRVQTSDTWFDPDNETDNMKFAPTGSNAWDPTRYLNIWICDITSGAPGGLITVGYAYLPVGGVVGTSIDGLVIDYSYGTQLGARTATHEIGHYFGLMHTFDDDGACVNADGFSDTPTSNSPTFSCSNPNLMKCGVLTQYENFMDYSDCQVMYTAQQASYMSSILTGVRGGLLLNNACSGPVAGPCIPTSAGGTTDGDYINRVALGTFNNANSGGLAAPTYTDFSGTYNTSLTRGTSYTLTVQGGTFNDDNVAAWIDYDQDDTFEASEKLGEVAITQTNQTVTITFVVPAGATLGNTTLRVRNVYHNTGEPTPTDPCFSYDYGETEDYGITILNGGVGGPCIPTSTNGTTDGDYINRVALGTFNNANSGGLAAPTYTDFSGTYNTSLTRGTSYTLTVQGGTFNDDNVAAWIDYDQDDTFEASEKLGEVAITQANQTVTITFVVPAGATLGNTTLRVRNVFHLTGEPAPTDPCFSYGYGETEDYGITILNGGGGGLCIPSSTNGTTDGDYINRVALGTFNNANSGGPLAPAYTDFSSTYSTSLTRGTSYTLTVEGGTYNDDNVAAWIDYDQDDTFEANEKLGEVAITQANQTVTITFVVPAGATLGNTTLRVRNVFHLTGEPAPTDPCFNYGYGETEDYGITILNGGGGGLCIPTSEFGTADGDYVNGVILRTIDNMGSGGTTVPTYTDFSSNYSTTLVRNGQYGVIIQSGDYTPDAFAVWIDFDQDDVFEAEEKLGEFLSSAALESQVIPFDVPIGTPLGSTTMRVRGVFLGDTEPDPVDPCFNYAYGETEDYGITIAPAISDYCTPFTAVGTGDGDFINGVTLNTIVNLNTGGVNGSVYTDYFGTYNTSLSRANEYSLIIESGDYAPDTYTAWIDYDQNGSFEAIENLGEFVTTDVGETGLITFTVPANAPVGVTRMRVRGGYLLDGEPTPFDPCYPYVFGETEDYQVLVQFSTEVTNLGTEGFALWPNPATTQVTLRLANEEPARYAVMDMQGRLVLSGMTSGSLQTLDISTLASGTYAVQVVQAGTLYNSRLEVMAR